MRTIIYSVLLCFASCVAAQQLTFPAAPATDANGLARQLRTLAKQALTLYKDKDREEYFHNRMWLQLASGEYKGALASLDTYRGLLRRHDPERAAWMDRQFQIYASAKTGDDAGHVPFPEAYKQAFARVFTTLSNPDAYWVVRAMSIDAGSLQRAPAADLDRQRGKRSISVQDAVHLLRDYVVAHVYAAAGPFVNNLTAEDDRRRYVIEKDIQVRTPDGASLCTLVVRPRGSGRMPALLEYTIYADPDSNLDEARQAASHGYVGILGLTRGKGCSPDRAWAYVYDGTDASFLVDWITRQRWSDGRVGMMGGSYNGFTAWATAKHMPHGLKTIMVSAPAAPGVDVPMEGNVVWNFIYPWPFYTTDVKGLDNATYNDTARWNRLNHEWYVRGRAYRDLEKIDGRPNPIFDEWIAHPSYDGYWQSMIPYEADFSRINIPVLMTAGYFYGGPGAAVYYMSQHYKFNPHASDYLVIGPYDHFIAQRGTTRLLGGDLDSIAGYPLDAVGKIDIVELRYQWFDHVFKGAPMPSLLRDKVNYEVTGANIWKHAPSFDAMGKDRLRFYLSSGASGDAHRLSTKTPTGRSSTLLTVNLADRGDADRPTPGGAVLDNAIDTSNGLEFISKPLKEALEISGLFSGHLEFVVNKKDFDFEIDLYEETQEGRYFQLAPYWTRASYAGDPKQRQLLTPGKQTGLDFKSGRLMSHKLSAGSRIVAVLSVIKASNRQINYGTGKDVNDETIRDAGAPLQIQWLGSSYIELPVAR